MAGPFVVNRNGATIDAPPRRVFDYLADMARYGEWNPDPDFKTTALPQAQPGVGSVFRRERTAEMQGPLILRGGMGDSRVTMVKVTTITVYQPCRELVFETRNSYNGLLHSVETITFTLSPEPPEAPAPATNITLVAQIEAMIPSAFIGPVYAIRVARVAFDRLLGRRFSRFFPSVTVGPYLSRIKEMLETGKITSAI